MNHLAHRFNFKPSLWRVALATASTAAAFAVAGPAAALDVGKTQQDRAYVSGGASIEEARDLERSRADYRLWVVTADSRSGAWLAGAQTIVKDSQGNVVLETALDGPYLLVDLQPGRYSVEATVEGQRQTRQVQIGKSGTRRVVLGFNTDAQLSPEMPDRTVAAPAADAPYDPQSVLSQANNPPSPQQGLRPNAASPSAPAAPIPPADSGASSDLQNNSPAMDSLPPASPAEPSNQTPLNVPPTEAPSTAPAAEPLTQAPLNQAPSSNALGAQIPAASSNNASELQTSISGPVRAGDSAVNTAR